MKAETVSLGGSYTGYFARPDGAGPFPAVLVYQEAFGVNDYVQSEVRRLAEHGYAALAPDLFDGKTIAYTDRDAVMAMLGSLKDETLLTYVEAGLAFLAARDDVQKKPFGAVGFCMGGRLAFLSAASFPDRFAVAASFYGGSIAPKERGHFPPIIDRAPAIRAELLMIYGGDDTGITPEEHARIAETLSSHHKRYTLSVYPGAPHGFASRDRESYRKDAAEGAWAETLATFDRVLR